MSLKTGTRRTPGPVVYVVCVSVLMLFTTSTPVAAETIRGTDENDRLRGTPEADLVLGYGGNDDIRPHGGDDVVRGGPGNDDLFVDGNRRPDGSGRDRGYGGPGSDDVTSGPGDVVRMQGGDDYGWVYNSGGVLRGGTGRDVMWAYAPGRLYGGPGPDVVCGPGENGSLRQRTYRYWLGPGRDMAFGRNAEQDCYENEDTGRDVVIAGPGPDRLVFVEEEGGRDRVFAGPGEDVIRVANGRHRLVDGGSGRDTCIWVRGAVPDEVRSCERIIRQ